MSHISKADILAKVQNDGPIRMQDITELNQATMDDTQECFASCAEKLKELIGEGKIKSSIPEAGKVITYEAV